MLHRKIPRSGETLPAIGLRDAASTSADTEVLVELDDALRLVASWGGVIDSHPIRSTRQEAIGRSLATSGLDARAFISTKVCARGRHAGLRQMQGSLQRLLRKRADLILIENLTDWTTQFQTLRALKDEGLVRYIGLSADGCMPDDELEAALRRERFDFLELRYAIDDRAAERRLLPLALDQGIGVLVSHPSARSHEVCGGTRTSIDFVLQHPAVVAVLLDAREAMDVIGRTSPTSRHIMAEALLDRSSGACAATTTR
jgi:diketogulonate reductase-like aldo/keto reductase